MKVCIQAGHKGITSGATGAPGEQKWTSTIVPMIASRLREKGIEVYETDALAYEDTTVVSTDWDIFLATHYDADIYDERGGFADFPDASQDMVWETSKALAGKINDYYFRKTGIPYKPERSNANTKYYYMWRHLTEKTPCVLIECGVGNRKPQDYEILREYDFIADSISEAIIYALTDTVPIDECARKVEALEKELEEMRNSRNRWRDDYKELKEQYENDMAVWEDEKNSLETTVEALEDKIEDLTLELEECQEGHKKQLCEFPYFQRVLSLLYCRKTEDGENN